MQIILAVSAAINPSKICEGADVSLYVFSRDSS